MALTLTNDGEARILSIALGAAAQEALTLKLFTSNTVPAEADTAATAASLEWSFPRITRPSVPSASAPLRRL